MSRAMRRFSPAFLVPVLALAGSLVGPSAASAQESLAASCPGPRFGYVTSIVNAHLAQTFNPSLSGGLTRAEIDFQEQPGDTGDYVAQIHAVDGTGTPTNTVLSQTTVPEVSEGAATLNARFATPAAVVAGQAYALALMRPGDQISWGYRNDPAACSGKAFYRTGGTEPWGEVGLGIHDLVFSVFVAPPSPSSPTPPSPSSPTPPSPSSPTPPSPSSPTSATCRGIPATIVGTSGSDVRTGTPGRDVMLGLGGNDNLSGLGGNDVICGAKGNDALNGGKGKDTLLGQKGNDKLKGGPGRDKLSGKKGKDTLKGGGGNDKLKGGGGRDLCIGGKANDSASKCEVEKSI